MVAKKSEQTRIKEAKQASFLSGLVLGMTVSEASKYAGINRRTAYDWRDQSQAFANAWDDAITESTELSLYKYEQELRDRALDRGDKNSHLLLMFLIKKLNPEYRDNYKTETKVIHEKVQEISFSTEEIDTALEILTAAKDSSRKQESENS